MDKRLERMLEDLLKQPGNDNCADCHAPSPRWASVNLGIFLCVNCASIHRKMGTHKSRVKSVTLDTWTRDQITSVKSIGNKASNLIWNPDEKKFPPPGSSMTGTDERDSEMEKYIRKKYEQGAFKSDRSQHSSSSSSSTTLPAPTSLNRARDLQGRPGGAGGTRTPPTSSGSGILPRSSSFGAVNPRNPELNDILSVKPSSTTSNNGGLSSTYKPITKVTGVNGKEKDLPSLPEPRRRPSPSSSNRINGNGNGNLIDIGEGSNATRPLQINQNSTGYQGMNMINGAGGGINAVRGQAINQAAVGMASSFGQLNASPNSQGNQFMINQITGMANPWGGGAGPSSSYGQQPQQYLHPQHQSPPQQFGMGQQMFSSSPNGGRFHQMASMQQPSMMYGSSPLNGMNGMMGMAGTNGMNGMNGSYGVNGSDGMNGYSMGQGISFDQSQQQQQQQHQMMMGSSPIGFYQNQMGTGGMMYGMR